MSEYIVLRHQKGETDSAKVAIVVSAKIGLAVVRNKIKRRLREILRTKGLTTLGPGYYLLIAKRSIVKAKFDRLQSDILEVIKRIAEK